MSACRKEARSQLPSGPEVRLCEIRNDKRPSVYGSGVEPVLSELNHMDEKSAFRPCGCDLVEFFNSTGWAFLVQVDYFRVTDSGALSVVPETESE